MSPTRLHPIPHTAVKINDAFWAPRLKLLREVTLPAQYRQIEETGRLRNFWRAAGQAKGSFEGLFFNDSDVYKWMEAVSYALADQPDPTLQAQLDRVISAIEAAQDASGYLNTYFSGVRTAERWKNLRDMHELYCAGHFFEAAAAHYEATGSPRLLNVARHLADHIYTVFGPGGKAGAPGHPEVELALVKLFKTTGEKRYLELAQSFLDQRGRGVIGGSSYHIDHHPFRQLERLVGHAVRALYLCSGATDIYTFTGESELRQALERLWEHMVATQIYISGGIGSRYEGESFGDDYELPNARAYTETCAAIASLLWSWRMLQLDGQSRYADLLEWTLYNSILPGISLDGLSYFYVNPLRDDGHHHRQVWFTCACCPPNIARLFASLAGYLYSVSLEGIWVHLYAQNEAKLILPDNKTVEIAQKTNYPWEGVIDLEIRSAGEYSVFLRLPAWAAASPQPQLTVNGKVYAGKLICGEYVELRRAWQAGDVIHLSLPMPVRFLESHPYALENNGRVAIARGPLMYCAEAVDNPGMDLQMIAVDPTAVPLVAIQSDLPNSILAIQLQARAETFEPGWENRLYRPYHGKTKQSQACSTPLAAIPYYAWNNRQPGAMQVWFKLPA